MPCLAHLNAAFSFAKRIGLLGLGAVSCSVALPVAAVPGYVVYQFGKEGIVA